MKNLFHTTQSVTHKFAFYETPSHIDENHESCQAEAEALATDLTKEDLSALKTECDMNRSVDYSLANIDIAAAVEHGEMSSNEGAKAMAQNNFREMMQSTLGNRGMTRSDIAGAIAEYDAIQKMPDEADRAHAEMALEEKYNLEN